MNHHSLCQAKSTRGEGRAHFETAAMLGATTLLHTKGIIIFMMAAA